MQALINQVEDILRTIEHPAKEGNLLSLGFIEDIKIETNADNQPYQIRFRLVFPTRDPLAGSLKAACTEKLKAAFPQTRISIVEIVREKKREVRNINSLDDSQIKSIGKIVAVASGKGGVGKSTVTVNLAVALSRLGYKVGVVDADVYGPSIPKMTGTEGQQPDATLIDGKECFVPLEVYGIKWMSIGYFVAPEQSLIWRGPMACNALKQLILQSDWGELDFLLIDLPPGTGDIHITLVHDIPLSGAVIVTTPQDVALADVEKGINLFRNPKINTPIYGLVENMAWFTPEELPNNRYYIFGKDGGKAMAERYSIDLLGQVPIYMGIREGGDNGSPAALQQNPQGEAFLEIAETLAKKA